MISFACERRLMKRPDNSDAIVVAGTVAEVDIGERGRQRAHVLLLLQPLLDQCSRAVAEGFDIFFRVLQRW